MTIYGKVLSVETRNLAEPTTAAASIGATTLNVSDAATFSEEGGFASVDGTLLEYVAIDADLDTITLAAALTVAVPDQALVEVHPPTPVKTALVDLGDEGDPVTATVPHTLKEKFIDGTRFGDTAETVTLEQRGIYEWVVADTVAEPVVQTSLDYVEAEVGYGLSQAVVQVQDLKAVGQVSAAGITVDAINLGGDDLATRLAESATGKIISARLPTQGAPIALSTTLSKILELNCGVVPGGRTYRISTFMMMQGTGTINANTDRIQFVYRYTVDGTTPTTTSPIMDGGGGDNSWPANTQLVTIKPEAEVDIATTCALRVALTADVLSGAGAYNIYAGGQAHSQPLMTLYDDGPLGARNDSAITLTGAGISRFVKTYNATWAFGINADYGSTLLDSYFHIGGESDSCGFVGFDSASMVAQLAGATTPISCVVRWRPRSRQTSAGLDARLATHNFSSSSAASAASGGLPFFANSNLAGYGLTLLSNIRNNGVPGTSYDESLGTTIFNQFKAGSRKGVAFLGTPAASQTGGEGTVYGDGSYQCQLIFTYDGTS